MTDKTVNRNETTFQRKYLENRIQKLISRVKDRELIDVILIDSLNNTRHPRD